MHITDMATDRPFWPAEHRGNDKKSALQPPGAGTGAAAPVEEAEQGEKLPGVLRNLMNGHYKGVADVRLRIVFHDRLAALQEQARQEAAPEKVDEFSSGLAAEFQKLVEDKAPGGDQEEVQGHVEKFLEIVEASGQGVGTGEVQLSALRAALEEAFAALAESLLQHFKQEQPVPGASPEEGVEASSLEADGEAGSGVLEATGSEGLWISTLVEELEATLAASLDGLDAGLANVQVLPPLSPDPGTGSAYAKFLAQYQSLQTPPPEPTVQDLA